MPQPEEPEFLKFATIKKYITAVKHMKSSDDAVTLLITECDSIIKTLITQAGLLAKEVGRNTILEEDITAALEAQSTLKDLTWQELTEALLLKNSQDLDHIYAALTDYIKKKEAS